MLLPTLPALFNLFITNATSERLSSVHQSCLADRYYGTYGDQSLFVVDRNSQCDPVELKLDLVWESSSICVYPHHELIFLKKMDIESAISDEHTLLGGLKHLASHITGDASATPSTQWPVTNNAPTYSIQYHTNHSTLLSISPHLLPYIDRALPPSYKVYALPRVPLPFRRVPDEAKGRIRQWTHSVEYNDDIGWVVEGLSVSQLRDDVRYLTGEDPDSPILSRSSFSEGGRLAAEWILDQIEDTGAECELQRFLPGFAPNVIWWVPPPHSSLDFQGNYFFLSRYDSPDDAAGTIILSSHYDSRGSLGNSRAPGGDDNGRYLRVFGGKTPLKSSRIGDGSDPLDRA